MSSPTPAQQKAAADKRRVLECLIRPAGIYVDGNKKAAATAAIKTAMIAAAEPFLLRK